MSENKGRILIVEDEVIIAEDIRKTLTRFNYDVLEIVTFGEIAIQRAEELRPDVIMMDIMLEGDMNGIEAARIIRGKLDIPIIFSTAYADEKTIEAAKYVGPFGYIVKPFEDRELNATVEMAIYRHRLEMEVKASESRFRQLISGNVDGMIVTDKRGVVLFVNPAWESFLNKKSDELLNRTLDYPVVPGTISEIVVPFNDDYLIGEMQVSEFQWEKKPAYLATVRDVTQRKLAEEEKEKINSQLIQSQKMEVVGKIAGSVAHDFNNLLTAINGYAEIALIKIPEDDPIRDNLEIIKSCGEKATTLTRQLLAFSRKQSNERQYISLNDVINDMNKIVTRLLGEDVQMDIQTNPTLFNVLADQVQIEQVVMNLVVNARDAMPKGGTITLKTENVFITEENSTEYNFTKPGNYVQFSVSDTGTGIPEHVAAKIFDPFFTTKEKGKGTGLGLSTVKNILEKNGGLILLDSVIGQGTTFRLLFMAQLEDEVSEFDEIINEAFDGVGTETILLVDDEEIVKEFVSEILSENGYKVLDANNGKQALELMEKFDGEINLLLTDLRMPMMGGVELAEKLHEDNPDLKVLFMSGYAKDSDLEEDGEHIVGYLQKPFSYGALVSKVREILDK